MARSTHETKFVLSASDKTKAAVKSAEAGFQGLNRMVSKLAVGFAGLAGAGGIGILINSQVNAARQARAYSAALGMNIEDLTRWQAASETVGIGADKMADIFKDTAEKIGDAYRNGAGEAKEAVDTLGLSLDDLAKMSPDQQLLAIANAMQNVQTQGEKIQIMEALASDAALLLPLLDNNAEKLRELTQLADTTGKTLTRFESDKLQAAGEAMGQLNMATEGFQQTLAVELAGPLADFITDMSTRLPFGINTAQTALKQFQIAALDMYADVAGYFASEENEIIKAVRGTITRLTQEVLDLEAKRRQITVTPPGGMDPDKYGGSGGGKDAPEDPMISQSALEKMQASLEAQMGTRRQIIMDSYMEELAFIDQAEAQGLETRVGYDEMRLMSYMKMNEAIIREDEKTARQREQIEANVQAKAASLRNMGLSIGIGMLRQLGQEHEGAAYAAIALEKAIALAQIETSTAAAIAGANTLYALGPAGPAAAETAKARILSDAAFARGMVIASGILEASQVGRGGGGAGGGGAVPVTPVQSPTNLAPISSTSAPEQGNQITIVIKGEGGFDDMVRNSVETLSNNDELVIIRG